VTPIGTEDWMKKAGGFTIVEFIVALVLLSLVLVAAISFLMFQTGYGGEASKKRSFSDSASLALLMIRQDVMHSGYGLSGNLGLAVYLGDKKSDDTGYTSLYVNYGRYLGTAHADGADIFDAEACFSGDSSYYFPSSNTFKTTATEVDEPEKNMDPSKIGGLIDSGGGVILFQRPYPTDIGGFYTYTLASSVAGGNEYAPAVCYRLEPLDRTQPYNVNSNPYTCLTRNGEVLLGYAKLIDSTGTVTDQIDGDQNFRVTDFRVGAMFYDASEASVSDREKWSPDGTVGHDFENSSFNLQMADLRQLELTIYYRVKQQSAGVFRDDEGELQSTWSGVRKADGTYDVDKDLSKTITVTPRNVVLAQY